MALGIINNGDSGLVARNAINDNFAQTFIDGGQSKAANRSIGNKDAFWLDFKTNNIIRLRVNADGKIQIGYSSPPAATYAFEVNGDINIPSGSNFFINGTPLSGGDFSDGGDSASADRTLGNTNAWDLGFLTSGIERMQILANGKIGIGYLNTFTSDLAVAGQVSIGTQDPYSISTKLTIVTDGDDTSYRAINISNTSSSVAAIYGDGSAYFSNKIILHASSQNHSFEATSNILSINHYKDGSSGLHQIQFNFDAGSERSFTIFRTEFRAYDATRDICCNKYYPFLGNVNNKDTQVDGRIFISPLIFNSSSSYNGGVIIDARPNLGTAFPPVGTEDIMTIQYNGGVKARFTADGKLDILNALHINGTQVVIARLAAISSPVLTGATLTDSTGGTADTTCVAISGSGDDANINNNFADLIAQVNNLISDTQTNKTAIDDIRSRMQTHGLTN